MTSWNEGRVVSSWPVIFSSSSPPTFTVIFPTIYSVSFVVDPFAPSCIPELPKPSMMGLNKAFCHPIHVGHARYSLSHTMTMQFEIKVRLPLGRKTWVLFRLFYSSTWLFVYTTHKTKKSPLRTFLYSHYCIIFFRSMKSPSYLYSVERCISVGECRFMTTK